MDTNPWQVENLQAFIFLNCPECNFKTKQKNSFQDHAVITHPLSYGFFNKLIENDSYNYDSTENYDQFKAENLEFEELQSDVTQEEVMFSEVKDDSNFHRQSYRLSLIN